MMNNKNLVIFMPFIGGGGVEKNLYLIANHFSKKFNKVKICTLSIDKKKQFNKKIKFISPYKNIYNNINIRLKYLVCLFLLLKFLIKNKNSLVFAFQANIYCILLCKFLNVKIIVRSNSSPSGWYHNFFKKIIYKFIISKADKVIVNSKEFKTQMETKFKIKVNCIFNPLNSIEIIKKSKKGKADFFFKNNKYIKLVNLGRLTDQKDQITILKALNILKKSLNVRLLILGRGIEKKRLNSYINKNHLNKYVKIRDFIDNPFKIIKQSDIFILSSKYEGLPNVLLEAACLKKFIISTKCPTGPNEILSNGKGGLFFKIGDYHDLASKIKYALDNRMLMKKKINHCYKNLKKYDYDKNLKNYFKLVHQVLNSS